MAIKSELLQLKITPKMLRELQESAEKQEKNTAEVTREAIEMYLKSNK